MYLIALESMLGSDVHRPARHKGAKPGAYRVLVIVYSQQTQQRLRVDGADSATLATLEVDVSGR